MKDDRSLTLRAEPRNVLGKPAKQLRKAGLVPASVYRHGSESVHVTVAVPEFQKVYQKAGTSTRVQLCIGEDAAMQVLVHKVDRHPISGTFLHVELLELRMTEITTVDVPLRFVGEAAAARVFGAAIVTERNHLRVAALPADLPGHIDVDLSALEAPLDRIRVGDLPLPANVTVLGSPDEVVASAVPKSKREEAADAAAEAEPAA
ncbi:MAG: 50S ribosomal protein L25 [Armatimonadetes bacterium]|nr:50S ribosomal protein L25 [Armatimonadota bacterium]